MLRLSSFAISNHSISLSSRYAVDETLLTLVALLLGFSTTALNGLGGLVDGVPGKGKLATYPQGNSKVWQFT